MAFTFKDFKNRLSEKQNDLKISIHPTWNGDSCPCIWVSYNGINATEEYHYELNADSTAEAKHDGKHIFVEVHFEGSHWDIFYNNLKNSGLTEFSWLKKKGFRMKNDGFDMDTPVDTVIAELKQLDERVGNIIRQTMEQIKIDDIVNLLEKKKNIILQGAPGVGKTYTTAALALRICEETVNDWNDHSEVMKRYEQLQKEGRIGFCTFHQSFDYEDFVEGIKPQIIGEDDRMVYKVEDGIFKKLCKNATKKPQNYVLIIDEINRGNVSKIFGELITLLEADKRIGGEHPIEADKRIGGKHPIKVTLPYSKDEFGVPSNLYIIGTMNTTDRSVGNIDYAVRRRFAFVTLPSNRDIVSKTNPSKAVELYDAVETFIKNNKLEMDFDDLMVGHSYFLVKDDSELNLKWQYEIIPLLREYYKDGLLKEEVKTTETIDGFITRWKKQSQ